VSREPTLNELIGDDATGAEREQLQRVHEMLLEAGPPPEISADLEKGPTLAMTLSRKPRRRPRAMILLAAALLVGLVFFAGYSVRSNKNASGPVEKPLMAAALKGTSFAPDAQGTIQVWSDTDGNGNWPMTLRVVGLPKLPPHNVYEV